MSCCGASKNVLKPNELNRKVTIQQVTNTVDAEGIVVETWADIATVWAGRKPLNGREFFAAAAINAEKTVKYVVRYRRGLKPNMRLVDSLDNVTYNIVAVLDDYYGDRTQTHLMCEVLEDGQ